MTETEKPIAEVAKDLGINETTLASQVSRARRAGTTSDGETDELEWLRRENVHRLTDAGTEANRLLNRERAAVEHGFANLKSWCLLTKVRVNAGTRLHTCGPCSS